ncbi:MAG: hypothetical protein KDB14_24430, partial [Planctomycetales bacterium]|nr:hypothetical protein [Planctomycetales bacterium]
QVFRNDSPELKANQQLNRMFRHYLEHVLSLETDRSLILYVVLEHEIKDIALQHSRRIVADTSQSSGTLDRVVTCLGRFGDKSDIPKLQALLQDERITNSWSRGQGKPLVRTQLRDRALAMLIHLVGKQPADFGFELTVAAEKVVFQPYSCGFETDEQREQAHKNWRKWWDENGDRFAEK